jgi:hypothetical protein
VLAELSCRLQSRARCPNQRQQRHRVGLEHIATSYLVERHLKHFLVNTAGMHKAFARICCSRCARRWRCLRLEHLPHTSVNPSASTRGGLVPHAGQTTTEWRRRVVAARGSEQWGRS